MRFSERFDVDRGGDDDWFDPLLIEDTRLFVDPFRIWASNEPPGPWEGAHDELLEFFNRVLQLVLRSGGNESSLHWRKAEQLVDFPEPAEFCLGYAQGTTRGSGSGRGLGREMLSAAREAIRSGLREVEHFEELALIKGGVGADRLSDIVCNVLKHRFVAYTQDVCERHNVPCRQVPVRHSSWDRVHLRWDDAGRRLPVNPFSERAVLLTPRAFLRDLPVVDPAEFWEYAWSNMNEELRTDFNYDVATNVDTDEIARLARRHPAAVRQYMSELEAGTHDPYDVEGDPRYEVSWWEDGQRIADEAPPPSISPDDDFPAFVAEVINVFRHSVEDRGDWELLWNGVRHVAERLVQKLFSSTAYHYCKANDIDLSPESNAGRGPVDFKLARGWTRRSLIEVKLANNAKFWHGIERQLPTYQKAEGVAVGFFVVVQFTDTDRERERRERVTEAADAVSRATDLDVRTMWIDARPRPSASNA